MMKRLLMVLLIAGAALAQQPPEEERGSRPGLAYRSEGLDQTNLFNGTVTLNVPLGQTYPVGGALTYGLIASYATNDWTEVRHEADGDSAKSWWTYRYPSRYQNAGLGWVVTLGKIVTATISSTEYYLAPDGGHHEFDPTLHPKDTPTSARYTRDGTYLRKQVAPNGTRKIEFPNGTTHTFDSAGDVTDIADAFGNWVHVDHTTRSTVGGTTDPYPDSPLWIITDSVGRTHRIFFRPGWDYVEEQWDLPPVPHDIVDRVELAAFDDPATPLADVATYTFVYDALPESLPDGSEPPLRLRTSRRSSKRPDPEVPDYVLVPILTSIQMPHGLSYSFTTDRGDQTTRTSDSGNLRQMVLPTGGRIDWTYQAYSFSSTVNINRGVLTRTVSDTTGRIIGSSDYVLGELSRAPDIGTDYSRTVITRDAAGTALTASRHYFTGCDNRFCSNAGAYGLPFTVTLPDVRGYRSSEILKPGPEPGPGRSGQSAHHQRLGVQCHHRSGLRSAAVGDESASVRPDVFVRRVGCDEDAWVSDLYQLQA